MTTPTYRDFKNMLLVFLCLVALAGIGCRGLVDRLTPADVSPQVSSYLGENQRDIVSLYEAKQMQDKIIIKHRTAQTELLREAEDDEVYYQDAIAVIQTSIAESQSLQDLVVGGEDQPFSLLGLLAGLTGGTAIGRALKRPGDYSPDEVRAIVAKAKAGVLNDPPAT